VSSDVLNAPDTGSTENKRDADTLEERKALIDEVYTSYYDKRKTEFWSQNRINTTSFYVASSTQREKLAIQNTMIGVLNLQR
jgi:hypothetical protein